MTQARILANNTLMIPGVGGAAAQHLRTVLVAGFAGDDYAAYQAVIPHAGELHSWDEEIARYGAKLRFSEARVHFPGLDERQYRR